MNKPSTDARSKPHFMAHPINGFSVQFDNGIQVSVIWNRFAYAEFRDRFNRNEVDINDPCDLRRSATAEVMVMDKDGHAIRMYDFACDGDIYPHMTPEDVAKLLAKVATLDPDTDLKTVRIC
jgi:hypothetical protein